MSWNIHKSSLVAIIAMMMCSSGRFLLPKASSFVNGKRRSTRPQRISQNQKSRIRHIVGLDMAPADPAPRRTMHTNQENCNLEPLVVCGPSGVGKGTVIEGLMNRFSNPPLFGFCVSHTTRQPRPGEVHGQHYCFTNVQDMQRQIDEGNFVEHAHVHGNLYGTSKQAIAELQKEDKITVLDIDMQGVMAVKKANIVAKYIYIAPPSMEELEQRLRRRATETEEAIQRRLGNAAKEISYGQQPNNFDYIVVNDEVEETVQKLVDFLKEWYPQLRNQK